MRVAAVAIESSTKRFAAGAAAFGFAVAAVIAVSGASVSAAPIKRQSAGPSGYAAPDVPRSVYRSNRVTGDHFYTIAPNEHASAKSKGGYSDQGQAFHAYEKAGTGRSPVFRALNPTNGDHFYTTDFAEYAQAIRTVYQVEGIAFYAHAGENDAPAGKFVEPVFRLSSHKTGDHFYTTDINENDAAVKKHKYVHEGIAFYAPLPE